MKNTSLKSIFGSKISILVLGLFVIILTSNVLLSAGHSPSGMIIEYDINTGELSATITHFVSGDSHYIDLIEVRKNSVLNQTHEYTSQYANIFIQLYSINCSIGDILNVKAYCSEGGSISKSLTVAENISTTPESTGLVAVSHICITLFVLIGYSVVTRKRTNPT